MELTIHIDPTLGISYDEILEFGRMSQAVGIRGLLRSDHYQISDDMVSPSTDAWTTLAGLVRELDLEHLGTLVSPMRFRHPGLLAKQVATVAAMSKGARLELGLGMGNHAREHLAYGFGFPPSKERLVQFREYLSIVCSLLREEEVTVSGQYYCLDGCRALPGALGARVILGSTGTGPRLLRLAVEFADELNIGLLDAHAVTHRIADGRRLLREIGRSPDEFAFSWGGLCILGRDRDELRTRAATVLGNRLLTAAVGLTDCDGPDEALERTSSFGLIGTLDEAFAHAQDYAAAGITRLILWDPFYDQEHVALVGELAAALADSV